MPSAFGQIGYSQPSKMIQPSEAIWGDCPAQDLLVGQQGYAVFKNFKDRLPQTGDGASVTWAINSGSFIWSTAYDSVISMTTGASDQDDAGIATRPLGPITPNGGGKLWFEASVSSAVITLARGVFVGVVNAAGLGTKLTISAASATKNSNTIGTSSGGQSGYGFWLHGDTLTNFDAVWFNSLQAATGATTLVTATNGGVVLANVLTANANNPNPGNLGFVPSTPPGVLVATVTTSQATSFGTLTPQQCLATQDPGQNPQVLLPNSVTGATGFVKLGLRYDGVQYLYFYVNGNQVAKMAISSSQDVTSDFAGIVQLMSGTAAAKVENVAFIHAAAQTIP